MTHIESALGFLARAPRRAALALLALPLGFPGCAGTEADNPFQPGADVIATPCKAHDEYAAFSSAEAESSAFRQPSPGARLLAVDGVADAPVAFVAAGYGLTSTAEVPVWLHCLEWALQGDELAVQLVGFSTGCGAEWAGRARQTKSGEIFIELTNTACAFAACGNCDYDVRTRLPIEPGTLPQSELTPVRVQTLDCDGAILGERTWSADIADSPRGMQCQYVPYIQTLSGFPISSDYQKELLAPCPSEDGATDATNAWVAECAEGYSCVDAMCVPACEDSCPLPGVLECVEGYCALADK